MWAGIVHELITCGSERVESVRGDDSIVGMITQRVK
jgi:hypothetical protein